LRISTMSRIAWYQEKIGAYDQQIWEKSLEQAELKGIRNKPKKTGHIKPDLIDVDLVRVAAVVLYIDVPSAAASEVVGPMCLMLLLGTVHCQIVSTESCRSSDGSPVTSPVTSQTSSRATSPKKLKLKLNRQTDSNSEYTQYLGLGNALISIHSSCFFNYKIQYLVKYCSLSENKCRQQLCVVKCLLYGQQQEAGNVTTVTTATPLEVKNLRPSEDSRPASDSDDILWEELLQGSDSASSASTDSGEEELHCHNHALSPPTILTSDEDEAFSQHQLSWLQACHPSKDRVSAIFWEKGECKKADMSVLEISGIILTRVKVVEQGMGYLVLGGLVTATLALLPFCFRLVQQLDVSRLSSITLHELAIMAAGKLSTGSYAFFFITTVERVFLTGLFFFMMCVAERTYKQRLLFAKLFSHITSARKAKKSEIPHFRLKKVQNIKMWLSLRSFLKRRGPQRSVDVIVSSIFLLALSIAFTICAQLLHSHHTFLDWESNWELLVWGAALLVFLLRLATLGAETNHKYSNASVLLTEQINLYLKMEKKPDKKDELSIVNNVLKLATKLLKELDTPFRLLGLTVNPLIYNITRVVILSAVSAVVSDLLGFNIRLWKIKS
uniref:PHTF1/2 N-terminal domain-containing protein n=1 Tax=Pygocentrus nattereri TaxID=42514 RepID=A0AAR2IW64_PYGNA